MAASPSAAHYRNVAARLGWRLGSRQADEHVRLTGALRLTGQPLYAVARLAWKFEGRPALDSDRDERAFIDCYVTAYRAHATQMEATARLAAESDRPAPKNAVGWGTTR